MDHRLSRIADATKVAADAWLAGYGWRRMEDLGSEMAGVVEAGLEEGWEWAG